MARRGGRAPPSALLLAVATSLALAAGVRAAGGGAGAAASAAAGEADAAASSAAAVRRAARGGDILAMPAGGNGGQALSEAHGEFVAEGGGARARARAAAYLAPTAGALARWLASLQLRVPPQSFDVADFNVTLLSLMCTNASVTGLVPSRPRRSAVALVAQGLALECSGDWSYVFMPTPGIVHGQGQLLGGVAKSSVSVTVALSENAEDGTRAAALPSSASLAACEADVHVANLSLTGSEVLEWVVEEIQGPFESLMEGAVDAALCGALQDAVATNLSAIMRASDAQLAPLLRPPATDPAPPLPKGAVHWRNNTLVSAAAYFVRAVLDGGGQWGINGVARLLTNGTGTLQLPATALEALSMHFSLPGDVGMLELNVTAAELLGLDDFQSIDAPSVPGPEGVLRATMWMRNLTLAADVAIVADPGSGSVHGSALREDARLVARLTPMLLGADLFVDLNSKAIGSLTLNQLAEPACLGEALGGVAVLGIDATVSIEVLTLMPRSGGALERGLDATIDEVGAMLLQDYGDAVSTLLAGALGGPVRDAASAALDDAVHNLTLGECYRGYDSTLVSKSVTMPVFLSLAFACFFMCALLAASWAILGALQAAREAERRRASLGENATPLLGLADAYPSDAGSLALLGDAEMRPALMWHPRIPRTLAWGMVLMVLGTIFLFVAGNLSAGAAVLLQVSRGVDGARETVTLPALFEFSLINSVHDMIQAKVWALAVIVAFFSGAWPYIKLLLMLLCWLAPPRLLSEGHRHRMLMALDALGKWSLIDSFMMIMFIVAFRFHLVTPPAGPGADSAEYSAIDVLVKPCAGIFTFVCATILSLLTGHLMLAAHRHAENNLGTSGRGKVAGGKTRLCSSAPAAWRVVVPLLLVLCALLQQVGVFQETFRFEFRGLTGWMLDEDAVRGFSVVGLANALPGDSPNPTGLGVIFLQATMLIFVVATVFMHLGVLMALWLAKLSEASQRRLFYAAEVLNSWVALDVFMVCIIASVLQIEQFSHFIIGSRCDAINGIIAEYLDSEVGGIDECFDVRSTLSRGTWLLVAAGLVWLAVGQTVMRLCEISLRRSRAQAQEETDINMEDG